MYYWCNYRQRKVRSKIVDAPEHLVNGVNPDKYLGILIEEREEMTRDENIERVKDKFRESAKGENFSAKNIDRIVAENGQVFLNPWKNDSFNVTLNNLKD